MCSALLVNLFQLLVILYCKLVLAELSRSWNTMGKKIWLPRHPRNFGRPYVRPPHCSRAKQRQKSVLHVQICFFAT